MTLSSTQIQDFNENGWLHYPSFYDSQTEILPLLKGIWDISLLVAKRHRCELPSQVFSPDTFDIPYNHLIDSDRRYAGEVYDLVKLLPAFVRLIGCEKNERLFKELRPGAQVGVGRGSYGIRIDNPREDLFRTFWHQDYLSHLGSVDGLVLWSPLCTVNDELGTLQVLRGSHKAGLQKMVLRDPDLNIEKGALQLYASNFAIKNEETLAENFVVDTIETRPGDLLVLDYLTIHQSGFNRGTRSRWTMQHRLFNFNHESGQRIGWQNGLAAGVDPRRIHPECFEVEF